MKTSEHPQHFLENCWVGKQAHHHIEYQYQYQYQSKAVRQLERKIEEKDSKNKTRHKAVPGNCHGAQAEVSDRATSLTLGCCHWKGDLYRKYL